MKISKYQFYTILSNLPDQDFNPTFHWFKGSRFFCFEKLLRFFQNNLKDNLSVLHHTKSLILCNNFSILIFSVFWSFLIKTKSTKMLKEFFYWTCERWYQCDLIFRLMAPPSIPQGQPIHIPIPPPPPPYTSGINQIFWALFIIIYLITQKEYWCSILSILFQLWIEIVFTDNHIWFSSFNVSTSTSYTSHRDSSASLFNQVTKCVRICLTEILRTFKFWYVI